MKIKGIIFEDFINYKNPCMTIMMPYCTFKCDKECGIQVCQNSHLANQDIIEIKDINNFIDKYYLGNPIPEAIVFQGLEPFDSFEELYSFIYKFTEKCDDDIVIYTGYNEDEIQDRIKDLVNIIESNTLIIKFGRFIPNHKPHYDEVLGVNLASDNQYAKVII